VVNLSSRPLRLVAASTAATALDVVTLLLLVHGAHAARGPAASVACIVGGAANFWLCRVWLAGLRAGRAGRAGRALDVVRQALLYGVLVVLVGGLWCGAAVHLLSARLALPLLAAKACASLLVLVAWNYPLSAYLIFRREETHA
jgi:putative flippase GtrA